LFYDCLKGFLDSEGKYQIKKLKILKFGFIFKIDLHCDDIFVLEYIYNKLKKGKVSLLNTKDKNKNSGTAVR
jgi:hypothetical protein